MAPLAAVLSASVVTGTHGAVLGSQHSSVPPDGLWSSSVLLTPEDMARSWVRGQVAAA